MLEASDDGTGRFALLIGKMGNALSPTNRRYRLRFPGPGLSDLVQLIVLLNTQPDIRIDPQHPFELKRRFGFYGGFPRDNLADEFRRSVASSCELHARNILGRKSFRQDPTRGNRIVGAVLVRRHHFVSACEDSGPVSGRLSSSSIRILLRPLLRICQINSDEKIFDWVL